MPIDEAARFLLKERIGGAMIPGELRCGFMCEHCGRDDLEACNMTAYQCRFCRGITFSVPVVCPVQEREALRDAARRFAQYVLDHFSEPEVRARALALLGG